MHPLIEAAAAGSLPPWAEASRKRVEHIARVSALLGEWADALDLSETDRKRWRAVGTLHDALHDAKHDALRTSVPESFRDAPGKLLHGPACVVRLEQEGVDDADLLHAIMYHTIGHPDFTTIGRALYAADYLEPGRPQDPEIRAALRSRMPVEMDAVVATILKARLLEQIGDGKKLRPETVAFWNVTTHERRA
jgi:2-amino-4-hydroxy-6-hydroxymethyldihydropteridine diphosphokinase